MAKEGTVADLGDLLLDVLVAARGVSDLVLTARTYEPATFREEVAGVLEERHIAYVPKAKVLGVSGKIYPIDFHLTETDRLLQTLSPGQASGVQNSINRTFRIWSDVNGARPRVGKLTLLNDVDHQWAEPDIALLMQVSAVHTWSKRQDLLSAILEPA
ncbi:MAG TPA: hypothetical protein QGF05_03515 [Dehalococcoidia bacterium]|nr:hypothetical protein [Dehalococcoidia bacterium]